MLNEISRLFVHVGQPNRKDDDVFDKISHRWTVILLSVFLVAIGSKHYFGDPIECWTPAEFKGSHNDYVKHFCWITYTYHVAPSVTLSQKTSRNDRTTYYIWVPYIFTISALLFYAPCWIWHSLGHRARYDIPRILSLVSSASSKSPDMLDAIAIYYDKKYQYIRYHNRKLISRIIACFMMPFGGGPVTCIYFLTKLLYLINAVGHFYLLNSMLGFSYHTYGIHVLFSIIRGSDWEESRFFPRSTFCDIGVRYKGDNYNNYTIQCVLPINLFHEKLFAVLWFWFVFVTLVTLIGLIYWLIQMCKSGRRQFVTSHFRINRYNDVTQSKLFDSFFNQYLGGDGILLLRLVSKNSSCTTAGELMTRLWKRYKASNSHHGQCDSELYGSEHEELNDNKFS